MSTLRHHRVGDLAPESRAMVETLVGRGLGDEDRVKLSVVEAEPVAQPDEDEADEGERQRQARVRLMEELADSPRVSQGEPDEGARRRQAWIRHIQESESMPLVPENDGFSVADIDRVLYGGPGGPA